MATQVRRFGAGTGANRITPSMTDDVVASQASDAERVRKGLSASGKSALTRGAAQEAAGRAILRTAGRASGAIGALETGWEAGRALDESTGIGKKLVDKALGPAKSDREGVVLSKESKDRIARGDLEPKDDVPDYTDDTPAPPKKSAAKKAASGPKSSVREGSNKNIDDDVRSRALASVSGYKKGGSVKARGIGLAVRGVKKHRMF